MYKKKFKILMAIILILVFAVTMSSCDKLPKNRKIPDNYVITPVIRQAEQNLLPVYTLVLTDEKMEFLDEGNTLDVSDLDNKSYTVLTPLLHSLMNYNSQQEIIGADFIALLYHYNNPYFIYNKNGELIARNIVQDAWELPLNDLLLRAANYYFEDHEGIYGGLGLSPSPN